MADLQSLLASAAIIRIEVPLGQHELPERLLFGTAGFIAWLDERVRLHEPSRLGADVTPLEALETLFYRFVSGGRLAPKIELRCIKPERNPVWELKTLEWRIFGWFPARDSFICVFGDWADHVKEHDLYRGYRLEVRRMRRAMALEDELAGLGGAVGDVISN